MHSGICGLSQSTLLSALWLSAVLYQVIIRVRRLCYQVWPVEVVQEPGRAFDPSAGIAVRFVRLSFSVLVGHSIPA